MRFKEAVEKLPEFKWGDTPKDKIVLKWGECQIQPPQSVVEEIEFAGKNCFAYPDPQKNEAYAALEEYTGFPRENLLVTNGSDKLLRLIPECVIEEGDSLVSMSPTFPVIESAAELAGGITRKIPLEAGKGFKLPLERVLEEAKDSKIVYLANPNNPTGNLLVKDEKNLRRILETDSLVVLDECYYEFSGISFAGLTREFDNLIVLRSLSKCFGMAGMRFGYSIASDGITKVLKRVEETVEPFDCSSISLAAGATALREVKYYEKERREIAGLRERLASELNSMGLECFASVSPFVFCGVSGISEGGNFAKRLEENGVVVKYYPNYGNFVRFGIPREENFEKVVEAVGKTCGELKGN
jgi:histidinol-phosphate aminotransferase